MKSFRTEIKFAIILTATTMLWILLERILGFHDERINLHPFVSMLILIPIVAIFYYCLKEKKSLTYQGQMSYFQGFMTTVRFTLFSALLSPLSQLIISKVISPDYFANAIVYSVNHGYLTQEQAENNFNLSSYIVQSLLGCLFMGLIIGAIMAAVVRTRRAS